MFGRGVDGDITFVISALLFFMCVSAENGMLEGLTDRKFAAMVEYPGSAAAKAECLQREEKVAGPSSKGGRGGA